MAIGKMNLASIRWLRYPVETILELLSAGMSIAEIVADYEELEPEDILAVLAPMRLNSLSSA